jgi:hypothetical protein
MSGVLPELLRDPEQHASLEARVAAAEALGAGDPRLAGNPLSVPGGAFWRGTADGSCCRPMQSIRIS